MSLSTVPTTPLRSRSSFFRHFAHSRQATPARLAGIYVLFGLLWVWLSDLLLAWAGIPKDLSFWIAILKGTVFVLLSATIIYLTARQEVTALLESSRLLHAVVEETPDAIFVKDAAGRYLMFNEGAARLTNRPAEEVLGKDDTALFDAESARVVMERDQRVMRNNKADTAEEELTASGVTRTYLAMKVPYRDERGNVIGIIGISRDITESKRALEALRESEQRFRATADAAPVTLWETAPDFFCTFVSRGWQELTGQPLEESLGFGWLELTHPDDAAAVEAVFKKGNELRQPVDVDYRVRLTNGEYRWVVDRGRPRFGTDGEYLGMVGVVIDITARKEAETLLRAERDRLEKIIETAPAVIASFRLRPDGTTCFPYTSPRIREIFGLEPEDVREDASAIFALIHPSDVDHVHESFAESARAMTPWFGDFRVINPTRGELWVEGHSVPVLDPDGGITWHGSLADVTERRRTEQALRDSEARLAEAQRVARMGSWRWEPATGQVWWSSAIFELFRVDPAQSQPSFALFLEQLHPDDRPRAIQRVEEVLAGASGFADDLRIVRPTEEVQWIHSQGRAIRDDAGRLLYVEGTDQDITERKMAEAAIRESEERFRATFEQAAVGIAHVAPDGQFLRVNQRFAKIVGYDRDELLSTMAQSITHPDDLKTDLYHVKQLLAGEISHYSPEKRYLRKDGGYVWANLTVSLRRDSEGEPIHFISVIEDITIRKQAEAALRQSEERFRTLMDALPDAVYVNACGPIVFCNPACVQLFGADSPEQIVGKTPFDLHPPKYHEATHRRMTAEMVKEHPVLRAEEEILRLDGRTVPVHVSTLPVVDRDADAILVVLHDLTEVRRLEEQFRQAHKMEAIGRLAGGIAHDFNNLLTVINGYTDLLQNESQGTDLYRASVTAIRDAGDRAAGLTKQLLAFSRRAIVTLKVLDLNDLLVQTERLLRRLIGEDIVLTISTCSRPCWVIADPGQLNQVILNLAVNARDAMPTGGQLSLSIRTRNIGESGNEDGPGLPAGGYVEMAVSDTGCGMDDEVQACIFDPFFTTKGQGKGTGLGLATVHGIVQQAGGDVVVESEVGQGTTFRIILPAAASASVSDTGEDQAGGRGSETVLVVEDEDTVRRFCQLALESQGYVVHTAAGGSEAIELLNHQANHIDLLVTDVVMPEMSGRELADTVREIAPDVQVLYVSGYTDDAIVRHGIQGEDVEFLQKPFTPLGLARKIREILDRPVARQ